jgi:hypothetical protein
MPAAAAQAITLQPIQRSTIRLRIIGDTPLVVHRFSEKARKQIADKQAGKARQKKEPKNPQEDFEQARYHLEDGRDGFPAAGLKRAAMSAFRFSDGIKKVEIAGALHVEPTQELVAIDGPEPTIREDAVRIAMGTTDLRYRPEYKTWAMEFGVLYNERAITAEQIVNLFNIAGFGIGLGENRPERGGQWGMFHVAADGEV